MAIVRTKDHRAIRQWVGQRGGRPVFIRGAGAKLAIDLPDGGPHPGLRDVTWDRWFEVFDRENLLFVYEPDSADSEYEIIEVVTP